MLQDTLRRKQAVRVSLARSHTRFGAFLPRQRAECDQLPGGSGPISFPGRGLGHVPEVPRK